MSDEQALTLIHLRHRLRRMAVGRDPSAEATRVLADFRCLSEQIDDPVIRCEHARWAVQLEKLCMDNEPTRRASAG